MQLQSRSHETAAANLSAMFVQAKAGHAQGSTTEGYLHAAKSSFLDAVELAEARLFNGVGTRMGTKKLPGLDSNQQPSG